mmetsp:Transcript_942/g.2032  ORF Transcript_942/g.2032 Transcript_942/m.2032 type:complete len:129 (-) Transcript_942:31-417(-)
MKRKKYDSEKKGCPDKDTFDESVSFTDLSLLLRQIEFLAAVQTKGRLQELERAKKTVVTEHTTMFSHTPEGKRDILLPSRGQTLDQNTHTPQRCTCTDTPHSSTPFQSQRHGKHSAHSLTSNEKDLHV